VQYRKLGSSELSVSEIALGSWLTYGGGVDRDAAEACVRRALDEGVNLIDTANVYSGGRAEAFLGEVLRDVPAALRFVCFEPLLEDLGAIDLSGISWVITAGETGPSARRMEEAWVLAIRDRCREAGVPFFFKQWGGVLKRQVPMWLESAELRPLVVGFEAANIGHGGTGALYVLMRRAR